MAQTQTKKRAAPKRTGSRSKAKAKPSSQSSSRAKSSKAKSSKAKSSKPKSAKPRATRSNGSSGNGSGGGGSNVEAVKHAVGDKAKTAGQSVGKAASKAKVPLLAGGAAIAGVGGAMALAASKGGRKKGMKNLKAAMPRKPKVKIKSGDLAKAAKEVGKVSAQVGEIADGISRASESSNGNGKHRSPIEVVLQGLTARR